MNITMDISLYPLDKNYSPVIRAFIDRLREYPGIQIKVQAMSTIISGDYSLCMEMVKNELASTMHSDRTIVSVLKIVNADLTDL